MTVEELLSEEFTLGRLPKIMKKIIKKGKDIKIGGTPRIIKYINNNEIFSSLLDELEEQAVRVNNSIKKPKVRLSDFYEPIKETKLYIEILKKMLEVDNSKKSRKSIQSEIYRLEKHIKEVLMPAYEAAKNRKIDDKYFKEWKKKVLK